MSLFTTSAVFLNIKHQTHMVGKKLMVSLTVKYSFFTPSLVDMVKAVYIVPFAAMFYRRLHQKVSLKSSFWIEGHGLEIKDWQRCNYTCLCLFLNLSPTAVHWASSTDPPSLIKKQFSCHSEKNVLRQQFLWRYECLFRRAVQGVPWSGFSLRRSSVDGRH